MARCLFCDEWAGVDAKWHESCRREFERSVERGGMLRRLMASAIRTAVTGIAFLLGLFAAPSRPARVPVVNAQSSPTRPMARRTENDSDRPGSGWHQPGDHHNN